MIEKRIPCFDPAMIAESGQCFRMNLSGHGIIDVVAFQRHLRVESLGGDLFRFSCSESEYLDIWSQYFDLDTDYGNIASLCSAEDSCLSAAVAYGKGLRILRQDPWETLVSFIISQRKNIPAIKKAVGDICRVFGKPITDEYGTWHAFPLPGSIAEASEGALASYRLGYREKYISAAARLVGDGQLDFDKMALLDDSKLYQRLVSVYGVGEKVANCVMLFGFHRLGVCPVDVWIKRIIDVQYHGDSPFDKYPGYAGVIQQYLFNFRSHLK